MVKLLQPCYDFRHIHAEANVFKMEIAAAVLCFILLAAGALGVILPVLPGIPLAWLGLFVYALATGFENITVLTIIVFLVLSLLTLLVDFIAPMLGAKKYKAGKLGMLGALVGSIVGVLALGFWGIILGPLAGAIIGEIIASRGNLKQSFGSGIGTMVGCVFGSLFKLVLILVMAGFFVAALF